MERAREGAMKRGTTEAVSVSDHEKPQYEK